MLDLIEREESKVRARHASWAREIDSSPIFKNVITLDPGLTHEAWVRLSVFTPGLEAQEIPARLHWALVRAVQKMGRKLDD